METMTDKDCWWKLYAHFEHGQPLTRYQENNIRILNSQKFFEWPSVL